MNDGKHYGGYKYRNKRDRNFTTRNTIFGTIVTAIAGAVVKDLTNENSNIKKLVNKIIHPMQIEEKSGKKIIDAKFKIEDD